MEDQPDTGQPWQTRGEFDAELHHLPRTSAAEFRAAAWPLWTSESLYPRTGWYWPAVGVRGFLAAVLALVPLSVPVALARGLTLGIDEWLFALAATAVMALLLISKRRSNQAVRRRLRRNRQLAAMSREIDALVADGIVPQAPAGWPHEVLAPLA